MSRVHVQPIGDLIEHDDIALHGRPGWATEVDQGLYGYAARKPTWLYYVVPDGPGAPPAMRWGRSGLPSCEKMPGAGQGRSHVRSSTPPEFRDVLLAMARSAYRVTA